MRLATRFALACAVTVAVLVLLAGLGLLRLVRVDVRDELDAALRAQAVKVRPVAVRTLAQPGAPAAPAGLTPPADGGVALFGNGGWAIVGEHPPVDRLPATGTGAKTILSDGVSWRAVVVNVPAADGRRGRLWCSRRPASRSGSWTGCGCASAWWRCSRCRLPAWPAGWWGGRRPGRCAGCSSGSRRYRLAGGGGGSGVPEIDEVAASSTRR